MKGYIETIKNFLSASADEIMCDLKAIYPEAEKSQIKSWENLINDIKTADNVTDIPEDCVIAIEYSLPTDGMAIDCTILGYDSNNNKAGVLVESKQWDDNYINEQQFSAYRGEGVELHPQVQISRHKLSFKDYLDIGQEYQVEPFVYVKNCSEQTVVTLIQRNPLPSTKMVPIYNSYEGLIRDAITVLKSGSTEIMDDLRQAQFCPSKNIADAMSALVEKEEPFVLTTEQKEIVLKIKNSLEQGKRIIRIKGNAGSGKTAVLLNLYVEYLNCEEQDVVPIFISGAQNTTYYKNRYSEVEASFTYSLVVENMLEQNKNKKCIVLMDEAQHNNPGIITKICDSNAVLILCYDVKQVISADNPIFELEEIKKRGDYEELELEGSVRFNGSLVAERNIKEFLRGSYKLERDEMFDFRVFEDFEYFQQNIIEIIQKEPESTFAVIGLLSDDASQYTIDENSDSLFFTKWGKHKECEWLPYVYNRNYFEQHDGKLWVGTWWMPGLDVDYVAVIGGGDVKITAKGIEAIPEKAKHYKMMISVAKKLCFLDKVVEYKNDNYNRPSIDNYATVKNIISYINSSENEVIKSVYAQYFSKYLRNNYYIMMTRGRKGCFVYFSNNEITNKEK